MADNALRPFLICYDITDPRRLGRVHRYLVKTCVPVQYSVFLAWTNKPGLQTILDGVAALIDPRTDDVRAYPLPSKPEYRQLGRQLFPDGIIWAGGGAQGDLFSSMS